MKTRNIYLIILLFLGSYTGIYAQTLHEQATQKMSTLQALISDAEAKGLDVHREKLTIATAETFLVFANWDEQNISTNETYFKLVTPYKDNANQMAQDLADWERSDVLTMLDESIRTIQQLINGEITRKATPIVDWSEVEHVGDQLTYQNRPVFLADYTWKPEDADLEEFFGQQDGFYISPAHVINKEGDVNQNQINDLLTKPSGDIGFIFINNKGVKDWAENEYGPDFRMREDTYTNYDIDNPGAQKMMGALIKETVPLMAGKKYRELGYMLCNEPHFYTTTTGDKLDWASGPVSEYTIDKFRVWLEQKHQDISSLNTLWGTNFAAFTDVAIEIPIDNALQGTAKWYDWTAFNNHRVLEWYKWLQAEIQKYDTEAKVHLKIMPNLWSNNKRGHGIDFEALTEMSEIIGNDAGAQYNKLWGPEQEWEEHYSFEWREMCMSYDFLKSVSPDKIIYNSEAHYLSTVRSRDLYMNPQYARATFWMAHTQGLNASQIWYWPRNVDGSLRKDPGKGYAGSNNQQPRVTREVAATMMDLNAYSEEITAMQRQRKPIRIFYSETSAINSASYMDDIFALYEQLFFNGVPLGFVTESILDKQDPSNWDVVLVHQTENITASELQALQKYSDNGGKVIIDGVSLCKNEYNESLEGLNGANVIKVSSLSEYKQKAFDLIEASSGLPLITVDESNEHNINGCTWKCVKNASGNYVVSIVNLGKYNTKVNIGLKNAAHPLSCINLLNGKNLGSEIEIDKYGVVFIEVKDEAPTAINNKQDKNILLGELYPNPTSGKFTIDLFETQQDINICLMDMNGKVLLTDKKSELSTIEQDLTAYPNGNYLVCITTSNTKQTFKLNKI